MFPATKYVSSKACYFFSCGFVLAWKCTSFSWILKIASIGIQSSLSLTLLTFLSVQDPWNRLQSFIAFLKSSAEFEVCREKWQHWRRIASYLTYLYCLSIGIACSFSVTVQKLWLFRSCFTYTYKLTFPLRFYMQLVLVGCRCFDTHFLSSFSFMAANGEKASSLIALRGFGWLYLGRCWELRSGRSSGAALTWYGRFKIPLEWQRTNTMIKKHRFHLLQKPDARMLQWKAPLPVVYIYVVYEYMVGNELMLTYVHKILRAWTNFVIRGRFWMYTLALARCHGLWTLMERK